jgi:hypothetical protein
VDVTLYGASLDLWREYITSRQAEEWLLRWAIRFTKAAVTISLPLWMAATLIRVLLNFLVILTLGLFGLVLLPVHWLLIRPLTWAVLASADLWENRPVTRPLLLVLGPLVAAITMVIVSLTPDANVDFLRARLILCELWPLSNRRLRWIHEHGNGLEPS